MIWMAIDPGVRCCGWALFTDDKFVRCGLSRRAAALKEDLAGFRAMISAMPGREMQIVERPQIYRQSRSKGDPEDLARLLILCGMLAERHKSTTLVIPHRWKGTIPKTAKLQDYVIHRRNEKSFGNYLPTGIPTALAHNVADAVGIGLWWLQHN